MIGDLTMAEKQKKDGSPEDSSVQRSTRGMPEDQNPAIKHPGQYTADELDKQQSESEQSDQSAVEGTEK